MVDYKIIKGNLLTDSEKETLNQILEEYKHKLDLFVPNALIEIHIKEFDISGKRKRYCLIARVKAPKIRFESEAMDWDFNKAVHKIMDKLLHEMQHKFKK